MKTATLTMVRMSLKEEKCLSYQASHLENKVMNQQNKKTTNQNQQPKKVHLASLLKALIAVNKLKINKNKKDLSKLKIKKKNIKAK